MPVRFYREQIVGENNTTDSPPARIAPPPVISADFTGIPAGMVRRP